MEKLERVQSMTYRRMSHIDGELERFEERPELDIHGRHGSLLRRFEELENLLYKLRRLDGPDPRQIVQRIFAEHAGSLPRQAKMSVASASTPFKNRQPANQQYHGILPDAPGGKWPGY
jgi:hypothetical protein